MTLGLSNPSIIAILKAIFLLSSSSNKQKSQQKRLIKPLLNALHLFQALRFGIYQMRLTESILRTSLILRNPIHILALIAVVGNIIAVAVDVLHYINIKAHLSAVIMRRIARIQNAHNIIQLCV